VLCASGYDYAQLLGPGGHLTAQHHPLKTELADNVGAKLRDLRPTLLLFLRKLRALAITDTIDGMVRGVLIMG
jgi:hypothetical protein